MPEPHRGPVSNIQVPELTTLRDAANSPTKPFLDTSIASPAIQIYTHSTPHGGRLTTLPIPPLRTLAAAANVPSPPTEANPPDFVIGPLAGVRVPHLKTLERASMNSEPALALPSKSTILSRSQASDAPSHNLQGAKTLHRGDKTTTEDPYAFLAKYPRRDVPPLQDLLATHPIAAEPKPSDTPIAQLALVTGDNAVNTKSPTAPVSSAQAAQAPSSRTTHQQASTKPNNVTQASTETLEKPTQAPPAKIHDKTTPTQPKQVSSPTKTAPAPSPTHSRKHDPTPVVFAVVQLPAMGLPDYHLSFELDEPPATDAAATTTKTANTTAHTAPASSVPASSVPASSVPASSVPASSVPASSVPASSVPASSTRETSATASTGTGSASAPSDTPSQGTHAQQRASSASAPRPKTPLDQATATNPTPAVATASTTNTTPPATAAPATAAPVTAAVATAAPATHSTPSSTHSIVPSFQEPAPAAALPTPPSPVPPLPTRPPVTLQRGQTRILAPLLHPTAHPPHPTSSSSSSSNSTSAIAAPSSHNHTQPSSRGGPVTALPPVVATPGVQRVYTSAALPTRAPTQGMSIRQISLGKGLRGPRVPLTMGSAVAPQPRHVTMVPNTSMASHKNQEPRRIDASFHRPMENSSPSPTVVPNLPGIHRRPTSTIDPSVSRPTSNPNAQGSKAPHLRGMDRLPSSRK